MSVTGRAIDAAQDEVINAPTTARLVVESGPGCGKTDVACARTSVLLGSGIPGQAIVLLTFTRTAVRELRDRIAALSTPEVDARGVFVLTLDSFAWSIRKRLVDPNARLGGSGFDENFRQLNHVLGSGGTAPQRNMIQQYLDGLAHVMVDESQDLVGVRSEFVELLIGRLPEACGWTVFIDPAQAIYDWSDGLAGTERITPFLEKIRRLKGLHRTVTLRTNHRTGNRELLRVQAAARNLVLGPGIEDRCEQVRRSLLDGPLFSGRNADSHVLTEEAAANLNGNPSRFVLFRRRGDALMLSGNMVGGGISHRLRLGQLGGAAPGWVAGISARIDDQRWSEQAFDQAWASLTNSNPELVRERSCEDNWRALRGIAREGKVAVDRRKVADAIAMQMLPDELKQREIGRTGPILGTIHASKGREADEVILIVPRGRPEQEEPDEEARVLYVGLTRPRKNIRVIAGTGRSIFDYLESGRAWRFASTGNLQIEVGREGDVHPAGSLLAVTNPSETQRWLQSFDGKPVPVEASTTKEDPGLAGRDGWRLNLRLLNDPKTPLGSLTKEFSDEAFQATRKRWGRGATAFRYAHLMDVATVAVSTDDAVHPRLPEPWRSSRMWLAPVIVGLFVGFKPTPRH